MDGNIRSLLTIKDFANKHKAFTQSALRHLIFFAEENGFKKVIRRIGKRKILIDEESFFLWVDEQQK